jgi:pimeloyl-ACP methyl ester carboxylesterase
VGDSEGPPCPNVDFESEFSGYAATLTALREDPRVNPARVYLFGHSIGSAIVPRLAAKQPVAGIIVAEAFARNWIEYDLWNLRRQLVLAGDAPDRVDAALAEKEICMHRLLIGKEAESDIEKTLPACKLHDAYPAAASYMQQVAALNVAEAWTKVAVPTLAIYGTGDFVTTEADHRRIVDIVNATHAGAASLVLIPGMDHHLDVAGTPQQAYDLRVKAHGSGAYEPRMSAAVIGWLCLRERCSSG